MTGEDSMAGGESEGSVKSGVMVVPAGEEDCEESETCKGSEEFGEGSERGHDSIGSSKRGE